ncbi:DNA repair protein RecO [Halomonas sp. Bachu 37]|uniref:DNA repair protein RecO n=1 Tax=Halomonas kashgarensis TaxID=3084920 RepID=UPI00321805EB
MQPEPAFLLHRRAYRETSALVDLLTLNEGRISAVARGVQRPGSRARSRLQPFTPLHVTWQGKGELKRLVVMESHGSTALLVGEALLCGLYANELATRLLPNALRVADVFAFYGALLDALPTPVGRAPALRNYEFALLEALDASPRFCTPQGEALDPQRRYRFEPASRGFVEAPRGIEGRTLRLIDNGDWRAPGLAGPLKVVLRAALTPLLGARPLRSRELMTALVQRRHRHAT